MPAHVPVRNTNNSPQATTNQTDENISMVQIDGISDKHGRGLATSTYYTTQHHCKINKTSKTPNIPNTPIRNDRVE